MRLIRHILNFLWVKLWAVLANRGIGDPLNQLLYVTPYRVVPLRYTYRPRRILSYRRNYKLEAKIKDELAQLSTKEKGAA